MRIHPIKSNGGIKGGYINLASVVTETGKRINEMVFILAFYGESFISNSFSIQPELMYCKVMRLKCKAHFSKN
jgi:hypothetical protein